MCGVFGGVVVAVVAAAVAVVGGISDGVCVFVPSDLAPRFIGLSAYIPHST